MALFGQKKVIETAFGELMALLPPAADLAAELMPAFSPDGPNRGKDLSRTNLATWMLPRYEHSLSPQSAKAFRVIARMHLGLELDGTTLGRISAAVQLLEHAELIYQSRRLEQCDYWSATEFGLATLAAGNAAIRQRLEDRTGGAPAPAVAPPVAMSPQSSTAQRLQELQMLRATGAISDAEYTAKRKQIIDQL